MPHVQVVGAGPVKELAGRIEEFTVSRPPTVLKLLDAYTRRTAGKALLEVVVVEGHLRQNFFLLIREEEGSLIIRCHPILPVQKTDGVKQMIVEVAKRFIALSPGASVGNTNLGAFLDEPAPPDPPANQA